MPHVRYSRGDKCKANDEQMSRNILGYMPYLTYRALVYFYISKMVNSSLVGPRNEDQHQYGHTPYDSGGLPRTSMTQGRIFKVT